MMRHCGWARALQIIILSPVYLLAVVPLVIPPEAAAADSSSSFPKKWALHSGFGLLYHTELDYSLSIGLSRPAGPRSEAEFAFVVSTPSEGQVRLSTVQGKARLRLNTGARRSQRDQSYILFGVEFIAARDRARGTRLGGGIELGAGVDYRVAKSAAISLEGGVGFVVLSNSSHMASGGGSYPCVAGAQYSCVHEPVLQGLAAFVLGLRFEL
jgi:hypothetical protein